MNKKIILISCCVIVLVIMGGFNSIILYGTEHVSMQVESVFGVSENQDWWNCSWAYRKKITVNHSMVSETQQNFPLMVCNYSDFDLGDNAQIDGDDVVFVNGLSNSLLDFQMEKYNYYESGGFARFWAWVRLPYLSAGPSDTVLYMYYGNPDATSLENSTGVWDVNYTAVYHLNESDTVGGVGDRLDSTSHNEDLTPYNYDDDEATNSGKIDGADHLDGSGAAGDNLRCNCADISGNFTVSLWCNPDSKALGEAMYSSTGTPSQHNFQIDLGDSGTNYRFRGGTGGTLVNRDIGLATVGQFSYLTVTFDGTNLKLYYDGKIVDDDTWDSNGNIVNNRIGVNRGAAKWFDGIIDEVKVSNKSRSAGWINASYENQNDPWNFTKFGSEYGVLSAFKLRKEITIDTDQVDQDLQFFPLLINITDSDLAMYAQSNGNDIIFTDETVNWSTGTFDDILDHEVELYSSGAGELVAWVGVGLYDGSGPAAAGCISVLYMYYDCTCNVSNKENADDVWETSDMNGPDFRGVWHMNGSAGGADDSTSYDATGSRGGNPSNNPSGRIAGAVDLDGNDFFNMGMADYLNFSTVDFTIEFWLNTVDATAFSLPLSKMYYAGGRYWGYWAFLNSAAGKLGGLIGSNAGTQLTDSDATVNDGDWHHIVMSFDRTVDDLCRYYIDGETDQTTDINGVGDIDAKYQFYVGGVVVWGVIYYTGALDEIRIYEKSVDHAWVKASHANVVNTSTFLTWGNQESTLTYHPDATSNKAYRYTNTNHWGNTFKEAAAGITDTALPEFTAANYITVQTNDDVRVGASVTGGESNKYYPTRFTFNVSNIGINSITEIRLYWEGVIIVGTPTAKLFYYDENAPGSYDRWEDCDITTWSKDDECAQTLYANFANYINTSEIIAFAAVWKGTGGMFPRGIKTDCAYIEVDYSWSPRSESDY